MKFNKHTCKYAYPRIVIVSHSTSSYSPITAGMSSRELGNNLVRVRSSNVWAYGINVKDPERGIGDVVAQFKSNTGGPGDIYMYFDVPVKVYRQWVGAPSKGHFFWKYIRNRYTYAKLTGDKRTKLKNGVNTVR